VQSPEASRRRYLIFIDAALGRIGVVIAILLKVGFRLGLPLVGRFCLQFFKGIPRRRTLSRSCAGGITEGASLFPLLFDCLVDVVGHRVWDLNKVL
jgi:hypothetical protein